MMTRKRLRKNDTPVVDKTPPRMVPPRPPTTVEPYPTGHAKIELIPSPYPDMRGKIVRMSWRGGYAYLDMTPMEAMEIGDRLRAKAAESL